MGLPSWGNRTAPLISVTIPSLRILLFVKKRCLEAFVSGTITLNMVTNTNFSSNTEEIYLAKFLSPTNYTNISLNTTVKRTSRKNLMFGTQKGK